MAVEIDKESFEVDRLGKMMIRRRYLTDSRSEALTGLPAAVDGLPRVGSRGQVWISSADGRHVVDAVYEGVTEDPDETFDEFELLTEEREMPIESFPFLGDLNELYGAEVDPETGKVTFPETLPKPKSRLGQPLTLNSMKNKSDEAQNPMFGTTSFPITHTLARWSLIRKKVPQSLVRQERTIIDRLPSGFDYTGLKKRWYVRPLQKRKTGNAWSIEWAAFEVSAYNYLEALEQIKYLAGKK